MPGSTLSREAVPSVLLAMVEQLLETYAGPDHTELRQIMAKLGLRNDEWMWESATMILAALYAALLTHSRLRSEASLIARELIGQAPSLLPRRIAGGLQGHLARRLPSYTGVFEYTLTHGAPQAVERAVAKAAGSDAETLAIVKKVTDKLAEFRKELTSAGIKNGDLAPEQSVFRLAEDPLDALYLWVMTMTVFDYYRDVLSDITVT